MMKRFCVVLLCAGALACEGITGPNFPEVAGTYSGPLTVTSSLAGTASGTMVLTVVQATEQLTITGSVTFFGSTSQIPAITGTINETGFFTATAGGATAAAPDPDCGVMTTTSATINFSGGTVRFHQSITTTYCGSLAFDATLTR